MVPANNAMGISVGYFDVWQPGYAGGSVAIFEPGTNTLLSAYADQALTVPAANPQALQSMSQSGQNFGKFANPVYVGVPYELSVNGGSRTGVVAPSITDLSGQDASAALVTAAGGAVPHYLYDIVARNVDVVDKGVFLPTSNPSASASTNNATLVAAIGAAAALGGGIVRLPPGFFAFLSFSLPKNVIVNGAGRDVTVLQSQVADIVITYAGDGCGFRDITIDGVIIGVGSIGVFSKAKNDTVFDNVCIQRFETDLSAQGGHRAKWRTLFLDNAANGAILKGDVAASSGNNGDEFKFNIWVGGRVTNCTTVGVWIGFVDKDCWHNRIKDVGFEDNTGIATKITGARWTDLPGCWWTGNGSDLVVEDGSDTTKVAQNSVVGLHVSDFEISSTMSFTGKGQDIIFERGEFSGGTYTLTTLGNNIVTKDCTEDESVLITGNNATQWTRTRTELGDFPSSTGVTTAAVATEAWAYELAPGEVVFLEAKVIGNGRNVIDTAVFNIAQGAHRPGSTLAYDGQTVNFTPGAIVTGTTSGATARIIADADSGATGTLTLRDIVGEFVDDETITDSVGGTALANGTMAHQNAALLGSITSICAAVNTDAGWACIFTVTAGKVCVTVTGATNKTVEWSPAVQVTSG